MKTVRTLFIFSVMALAPLATHADASTTPPTATTTPPTATTTPVTPDTAIFTLRDGGVLVGPFTVTLPATSSAPLQLGPTGSADTHAVPARSVLAQLVALDTSHDEFAITDLQYFSSFSSFLVNCISVLAASASPDCYNWTYAVNGTFPFTGMDTYALQDGDKADIFFGSQWKISTDKAAVTTGESFTVTAQVYEPATGLYAPAVGAAVGAVQFDANFTAKEFATSTTDASGHATLSLAHAGAYSVGLASSGYFPNSPITVSTSTATSTPASDSNGGGGRGGGGTPPSSTVDVPAALGYLQSKQHQDGSFGASAFSDWAAIAFSAAGSTNNSALEKYLRTTTPSLSSVTDYERHAMALEAFGINPYSGTQTDYIAHIVSAFDGTQIGDVHLDNDDVFALFPLLSAGYGAHDAIIKKTTAFILSAQTAGGSWDESVDMTAAAIQALSEVDSLPGVSSALTKAKSYLHTEQQSNGGFNNSFSTSWALQAIAAFGDASSAWAPGGHTAAESLASLQQSDGGVELVSAPEQTRIWATEYAIPAALGKPWSAVLGSYNKPTAASEPSGAVLGAATSTPGVPVATSTAATATSSVVALVVPQLVPNPALVHEVKIKKPSEIITAPTTSPLPVAEAQAAVANASAGGFFHHLWEVILSFFTRWL